MNQRRHTSPRFLKLALAAVAIAHVGFGVSPTQAQQITTLIQFTNVWRYNQTGEDLGRGWVAPGYDDVTPSWQSGPALLAVESSPLAGSYNLATLVPNTIPTVLSLTGNGGTNGTTITCYFRTTFFNPFTNFSAVQLWATNLVDDGCVIYLNGGEVSRLRVPTNQNYLTYASGGANEGLLEPVNLGSARLLPGANSVAVEVHQTGPSVSMDVAWAMRLVALVSTQLVITNQPQSQAVTVGNSVMFKVGVSGTPASYRWERNGVLLPSTSNTLNIISAEFASAGDYRVIITNSISAVTSSVATLTVIADRNGPRLIAAVGNNSPPGLSPFGLNTINVMFDDFMNQTTVLNTNKDTVTRIGTTNTVRVLSIQYSQILGALLSIDSTDPDWAPGDDYVLTVNRIQDARGNVIAPDSQAAVAWPRHIDLLAGNAVWSFHTSAIFDPTIYDEDWTSTPYIEGLWWGQGRGIFCGGPAAPLTCFGATTQTEIGFQPEPSLFRTAFQWPAELGSTAQLRISMAADDGLILYLNGQVIARSNVAASVINVSSVSRATASIVNAACVTNIIVTVTNLLPGTNGLAAAVLQSASGDGSDTIFGLRLTGTVYLAPALPDAPSPTLNLNLLNTNSVRLSWSGGGYALESSTNLDLGSASHPTGPWQQVTNMSNPYTNRIDESQRFFRLKK